MQKVRFLQDFQGRETREVFYKQGQEVELPDDLADLLAADRRVELVKAPVSQKVEAVLDENQEWVEAPKRKRQK